MKRFMTSPFFFIIAFMLLNSYGIETRAQSHSEPHSQLDVTRFEDVQIFNSRTTWTYNPIKIRDHLLEVRREAYLSRKPLPIISLIISEKDGRRREIQQMAEELGFTRFKFVDPSEIQQTTEVAIDKMTELNPSISPKTMKEWWRSKYEPAQGAQKQELLTIGNIVLFNDLVLGGIIWFSVGLDPKIAALMTLSQAIVDYWWTIHQKTINNIFAGRNQNEGHSKTYSYIHEISLRLGVSLIFTSFWRALSTFYGPYGSTHLLSTLQGSFEVLWNVLIDGLPASVFTTAAARELNRATFQRLGLTVFTAAILISTIDLAGLSFFSWLLHIQIPLGPSVELMIKDTHLLMVGFWVAMMAWIRISPGTISKVINHVYTQIDKFYSAGNQPIHWPFKTLSCEGLL